MAISTELWRQQQQEAVYLDYDSMVVREREMARDIMKKSVFEKLVQDSFFQANPPACGLGMPPVPAPAEHGNDRVKIGVLTQRQRLLLCP